MIGGDIKVSWLREKAGKGLIPSTVIAGRLLFTDRQIAEIVAEGERRPQPAPVRTRNRRTAAEPVPVPAAQPARPLIVLRPKVPRRMQQQKAS